MDGRIPNVQILVMNRLLLLALMALGILGFVFSSMVLMRCPRCKKLPSTGRGISLDPERCPHCGLRLKP